MVETGSGPRKIVPSLKRPFAQRAGSQGRPAGSPFVEPPASIGAAGGGDHPGEGEEQDRDEQHQDRQREREEHRTPAM